MDDRARGQREAEDGPRVVFGGEDTTQGGGEALDWTGRGALIGTPQTITRARGLIRGAHAYDVVMRARVASERRPRATHGERDAGKRDDRSPGADDGRRRSLD
jgi:hypothetical protein